MKTKNINFVKKTEKDFKTFEYGLTVNKGEDIPTLFEFFNKINNKSSQNNKNDLNALNRLKKCYMCDKYFTYKKYIGNGQDFCSDQCLEKYVLIMLDNDILTQIEVC